MKKKPIALKSLAQSIILLHRGIFSNYIIKSNEELDPEYFLRDKFARYLSLLNITYSIANMIFQYLSFKLVGPRRAIIGVNEMNDDFCFIMLDKTQYEIVNTTDVPAIFFEKSMPCITFLASLNGSKVRRLLMNDNKLVSFANNITFSLPASEEALYGTLQDAEMLCFNHAVLNRYFVEQNPCEFIINAYNVRSITIFDASEKGSIEYYFKVKYTDESIGVGFIKMETNHRCNNKWCPFEKYDLTFAPLKDSMRVYDISALGEFLKDNLNRLGVIIAACLRDLNVMEVETRDYIKQKRLSRNAENKKLKWSKVVWVPRKKIFYNKQKVEKLRVIKEAINELIPVMVNGHLRRCANPSQGQISIAKEYGIYPPEGFTFVRPYIKQIDKNYLTRFRSKSALLILYGEN